MNYKKYTIIGVILVLLLIAGYIQYSINQPTKIEIGEIGKTFTINISPDEIRDYRILDNEQFSLLKKSELDKVKEYMKNKNFEISPGEYILNQKDNYDELLKKLNLER